jgi:hypothetical protein
LPVAAGGGRDGFRLGDVDVAGGPLDRGAALQLVLEAVAALDVVIGRVDLGDLRGRQGNVMPSLVPIDELVLDDPVDLPRDGAEFPASIASSARSHRPRMRVLTASAPRLLVKSLASFGSPLSD